MPMDRSKYPANWEEIAKAIKDASGWQCKECGLKHGAKIVRSNVDASRYLLLDAESFEWGVIDGRRIHLSLIPEEFDLDKTQTVVLTVHHVGVPKEDGTPGSPNDKMDCRPENLKALCKRCHLIADMPTHIRNRRLNRIAARIEAGERMLW